MTNELAELLREASRELVRPRSEYARNLHDRLESAAASLEAQEPVAWMRGFVTYAGIDGRTDGERICSERKVYDDDLPLYRHPPTSAVPDMDSIKGICASFFRWWYNSPGTNTEQGFDEWAAGEGRAMLAAAQQQGGGDDE